MISVRGFFAWGRPLLRWAAAAALATTLAGCESDDDYDHDPPEGFGALYVDNENVNDVRVYVDGEYVGRVDDYDEEAFDLRPGIHRLVLDESGGDRYYASDLDIIEGRLTVVEVDAGSYEYNRFDVITHLE